MPKVSEQIVDDSGYQRPVEGALVFLLDRDGNEAETDSPNPTWTDNFGVFSFIVDDGVYRFSARMGGVEIARGELIAGSPPEFTGPTGPADNTYTTYAKLMASDPTRKSARLVPELGETEPAGNFSYINGAWVRQEADGLAYKLPATAAQLQSQADKNAQTVDLWDFLTDAMKASVRAGNLAVDCSPAFNAAIAFAYGVRPATEPVGDATGGTTLYIKGGRYRLNSPIKNTFRRDNAIVDDGDLRRLNIVGDGSNCTSLFYFGPADAPALEIAGYRGTSVNDGVKLRQKVTGIWLRRGPIGAKTGTGLRVSHAEGMMFDDVIVDGFETCLFATDILEFFANQVQLKDCAIGARLQLSDFTNPNVVRFDGCTVSGARQYGLHLIRPANCIIDTLRFEGNGFDANFIGILAELGTPEGGFSLGVYNSYFEGNMGLATLSLAHGFASDAMVEFARNTVHNDSATRFMQHHIDYARFGAAETAASNCVIAHGPQRYRNIGSYVSDPSRSAVRIQTPGALLVEHAGNKYPSNNERPETNGFATVGLLYPVLNASVAADGAYMNDPAVSINVASVTKTATGVYRIVYKTPPRQPQNVHVSVTQDNGFGFSTFVRASTYVEVLTADLAGNASDRPFSVTVTGDFA